MMTELDRMRMEVLMKSPIGKAIADKARAESAARIAELEATVETLQSLVSQMAPPKDDAKPDEQKASKKSKGAK